MALQVLHFILAINVLLSSTGVTVFEHLCQMKGRTASVFVKNQHCCQKKVAIKNACFKKSCCKTAAKSDGISFSSKPCCEDKTQFLKSSVEGAAFKTFSAPDFKFQPYLVEAVFYAERLDIIPLNQKILRFYLYKPPPKLADIRVLIQSFLC